MPIFIMNRAVGQQQNCGQKAEETKTGSTCMPAMAKIVVDIVQLQMLLAYQLSY
jgi:hypothetical protein